MHLTTLLLSLPQASPTYLNPGSCSVIPLPAIAAFLGLGILGCAQWSSIRRLLGIAADGVGDTDSDA